MGYFVLNMKDEANSQIEQELIDHVELYENSFKRC